MHPRIQTILANSNTEFRLLRHADFPGPISSAADFAAALDYDPARITKTLLLKASQNEEFALAVIPSIRRLNFSAIANAMNVKRCSVAPAKDLSRLLGYPPMGVSPLGAHGISVFVDRSLEGYNSILIGSGEPGSEIEIAPSLLLQLTTGRWLEIS